MTCRHVAQRGMQEDFDREYKGLNLNFPARTFFPPPPRDVTDDVIATEDTDFAALGAAAVFSPRRFIPLPGVRGADPRSLARSRLRLRVCGPSESARR